jgi:Tfp pilus assembly protein PilN
MKNISLLPAQVRNYQKTSMQRNTLIIVALAGVLVFVILYLILSISLIKPQENLKAIAQNKSGTEFRISELKQYEDELNRANEKGALVVKAMDANPDWAKLFNGLFNQLPANVWMTSINTEYKDGSGVLTIVGKATNYSGLSDWLLKLQGANGVQNAKCTYTSTDATNGSSTVNFEISATILQGEGYKLPAAGGNNQ